MKQHRYLVFAEGQFGPESSKTATSAVRYLPERVAAVIDSRHAGETSDRVLGFGPPIPVVAGVAAGLAEKPTALLIGVAPIGGGLADEWRPVLREAAEAGLALVAGLHAYLADDPELSDLAREHGIALHDLRCPPTNLPVGAGRARRTKALRLLTVGTDCNIGKMTAGLEIRDALQARGLRTGFAATGQTGILLEGSGIAVDAVKADFIAGAAEQLTIGAAEGNDVALVEGQGSLVHPGYSGVTLGLMHGVMPDVMILCHQPGRDTVFSYRGDYDWVRLPSLPEAIRLHEAAMAPVFASRVIGIALNTRALPEAEARQAIDQASEQTGLPATDPVRFGAEVLADAVGEWVSG